MIVNMKAIKYTGTTVSWRG